MPALGLGSSGWRSVVSSASRGRGSGRPSGDLADAVRGDRGAGRRETRSAARRKDPSRTLGQPFRAAVALGAHAGPTLHGRREQAVAWSGETRIYSAGPRGKGFHAGELRNRGDYEDCSSRLGRRQHYHQYHEQIGREDSVHDGGRVGARCTSDGGEPFDYTTIPAGHYDRVYTAPGESRASGTTSSSSASADHVERPPADPRRRLRAGHAARGARRWHERVGVDITAPQIEYASEVYAAPDDRSTRAPSRSCRSSPRSMRSPRSS